MADEPPVGRERDAEDEAGPLVQFVRWLDSRLGLSYPLLRPVPVYSINPFYWLGALTAVAFVIQSVTGVILLFWYVPDPTVAYPTTAYIFSSVDYGRFLETVHLYGAYSMILLAFMHMMRNYFVSTHKTPRELMWVVGMAMGFVTLGFGFTGYLLPWTVVSVDATNVGIGLLGPLPPALSSLAQSLLGVSGGAASELVRFYDIHIVVLPAILLLLLFGKMYMFETHGIGAPAKEVSAAQKRTVPFFPDATLYLLELAALFSAALFVISAVFPYDLPVQYSAVASQGFVAQPDWYFLWMYQLLKIASLGDNLPVALTLITLIFVALFVLPFIDRGGERRLANRPRFALLGVVFVAELAVLSYWGKVTPGQTIADEQAALVLGGTALVVALVFVGVYRLMFARLRGRLSSAGARQATMSMKRAQLWTAGLFTLLLVGGSLAISGSITEAAAMATLGASTPRLLEFSGYLAGVGLVVMGTIYLIYRLDLANGSIRTKVPVLEVGWLSNED